MSIDRERERREGEAGEAGEIEREIERANLEKSKVSEGGFNPEEGRKERWRF